MAKSPAAKPTLSIGSVCVWYPNADRGSGARAAQVTGPATENKNGILDLSVHPNQTATRQPVKGCRHVDDPYLKAHPGNAESRGGWDFVMPRRTSAKESESPTDG